MRITLLQTLVFSVLLMYYNTYWPPVEIGAGSGSLLRRTLGCFLMISGPLSLLM